MSRTVERYLVDLGNEILALARDANVAEKSKTQKKIIRDCLDGANGRAKVEGWLPDCMAFPARPCTETGTLGTAEAWARECDLFAAE